jgi:glycogen debranching enzyme
MAEGHVLRPTLPPQPPSIGAADTVTILEGASFCISGDGGDIVSQGTHGLFFLDTRLLSELMLFVDGERPELLAVVHDEPFRATFVARRPPGQDQRESTLLVTRHRTVGHGMSEEIVVRNLAAEPTYTRVTVRVGSDFADLPDVRMGRAHGGADVQHEVRPDGLLLSVGRGGARRGVLVRADRPARVEAGEVVFEAILPAGAEWRTVLEIVPTGDGDADPAGAPATAGSGIPSERLERWRRSLPVIEADHAGLAAVLARSLEDLGALRIFDPEVPERAVVAAGAPWSMNLFGRDSLLTSWMALLADPELALGVLETLARFQGHDVDPRTEEEPGRILHELRFGPSTLSFDRANVGYGSVDATPLFVMLLGELRRWGLAPEPVERLLPHADRALEWIERFGDRDGDGYVEYQRATDRGARHQGWREAAGLPFADGGEADTPIALAEVQGYVYAAYTARSHFAREAGDDEGAERWRTKASTLRSAFNRDFWLDDRGWLAVGLDRDKRPIDALTSCAGHCLWTGILDEEHARQVASRLVAPELFSGWGIRTLAATTPGYNPISYQAGSVWPHDNALAAAGLMRYGFVEEAQRVIGAQLDAALAFGGRLPELFAGFGRDELSRPVGYPGSCSPQAWAAAAPLLALRTLLRFDPWIPAGKLWLAPVLPAGWGRLRIEDVPLLGGRITLEIDNGVAKVEGLPAEVDVVAEPRLPLAAL